MGAELLRQYRLLEEEEREIEEELEQIESKLFNARSPALEHIPGGGNLQNAAEELTIKHLEIKEKQFSKIKEMLAIREEIERKIERLELIDQLVIRARYLSKYDTVEKAAESIHYSRAHFYRLLNEAEQNFMEEERKEELREEDKDRIRKRCPECGREIFMEPSEGELCYFIRCHVCHRYDIAYMTEDSCEEAFLKLEDYK